jgi:membrane protein YqaA with SNARE-associated domain
MISLFLSSFLAATILPISSEVHLALLSNTTESKIQILLVATLGNFLGGLSCYYLGYLGKWDWLNRFFKISNEKIIAYKNKLEKLRGWPAFFCWLPIIGDPLAVAYGFMKAPFYSFSFFMLVGKFLRYVFIIYLVGLI